ncbi:helix-turn-helix domain-containing protein [Cryocola sp. 340MFSha3.1]|uniref:helix-turn-helix domain-containing protein n=1 Tax=Cryocola sp. 340MFSha3.1 TaxID=1169145 RepID=UPI0003727818|nr:helix-turn-helix domain-containing protein [Cryocola sp. 340MFSha3.1]
MGFQLAELAMRVTAVRGPQKAVLLVVAMRADDGTGELFPSQQTLADHAGVSVATVGRTLATFEADGLISRSRRTPKHGYRTTDLIVIDARKLEGYTSHSNVAGSNVAPSYVADSTELHVTQYGATRLGDAYTKEEHSEEYSEEYSDTRSTNSTADDVTQTDTIARTGPETDDGDTTAEERTTAARRSVEDEYAEFYKAFPRKQGRAPGLTAYRVARKTTDAATLIDGARRYARRNRGTDPRFLKFPAGWLKDERWTDAEELPAPDSPAAGDQGDGGPSADWRDRFNNQGAECLRHAGHPRVGCGRCATEEAEVARAGPRAGIDPADPQTTDESSTS